ncbi:hypothetical protein L3X38_041614 [Prunus dulcis]|uniref:Uncharacterized protein n=1 Tax=Prunus dulcis TaxID=3755 RepID=A0AAD4YKF0_PRUDU|nr:hypothetical protein L3X38_041614 [Prunus dulcis]
MFTSLGLKRSAEVESLTYLNSPEKKAKSSKEGSFSRGQKRTIKSYWGRARKLHESGADLISEANLLEVNIQQSDEWTGAKTEREELRAGKGPRGSGDWPKIAARSP